MGAQGVPSTVDVVKDGIFVPSEFVCSVPEKNVGSEFLGWSLTDGGEILDDYITISADTTLYAVYSEPTGEQVVETENPKYGKLAYYVDFDVASGTAVPNVAFNSTTGTTSYKQLTTVSLPEIEGMPATVELEAYGSAYKTDGDNLVMVGQNFPRWWFAAYGEDGSSFASFPKGIYTVEYEAKGNVTNKLANVVAVFGNPTVWTNQDWVANVQDKGKFSDSYNVYTVTFTYDGSHVINVAGTKVSGSNSNGLNDFSAGLQKIGLYSGSGANYKNDNRYYKWVKMWYAPETINLSYDANGKDVTVPEASEVSSKVNFANLPKLDDCGTSRFAGWSETKNGEILTGEKLYGEDVTLYAVWDEHYYPEEGEPDKKYQLINISLNNFSGNNLQSQVFNYTEGGKYTYDGKSSQEIWKVLPGVKETTKWYLNVGSEGNRNAIYDPFNHPDNAFRIPMTLEANKVLYSKMFISSANMPDGIYTIATEVMLEKNDAITLAEVSMYIGAESDPIANLVDLSKNQNEKLYYTASMLMLGGKAYDAKTFELSDRSAVGASRFGLNFNLKASENTTVYAQIDNFRVYYQPYTGAPKSYTENSIRVVNPAGIRFKASVSDIERTNASLTEYGFVVTRKILLDNAGIDVNDFTFDSDVVKVPGKSYDKAANIDKIFETNKNETFFTAVVYNIPAQAYKDDIVVRPYVKYGDNYVYGDAMVRNIYDVAVQLKASADAEKYGEALDKIINGEEL